jgi:hypothetical protein
MMNIKVHSPKNLKMGSTVNALEEEMLQSSKRLKEAMEKGKKQTENK